MGLEDNLYLKRGELANNNAEQVTTPDEARQMLELKDRDTFKG